MKYFYLLLLIFLTAPVAFSQNLYFPPSDNTDTWETLSPDALNWCADSIQMLYDYLEQQQTKSFIVLKDGKIVLEEYFGTYTQDSLWLWFSAGKSMRALLVGIAQEEGYLDINDRTADYLGEGWTSLTSERENAITLWHQLTMTTGLDETEFTCTDPGCLTYVADAGTRWVYHNSPYSLLRDVLENATGQTLNQFTNSRLENKTGMGNGFWFGFGDNTFYLSKARDMARFGLLIQAEGTWNETPVISDMTFFQQMINTSQSLNPAYGYLWWLNGKSSYIPPGTALSFPGAIAPDAPEDVILAAGAEGQYISISPENGLVVVRQGLSSEDDLAAISLHNDIWSYLSRLECTISNTTKRDAKRVKFYPNPIIDGNLYLDNVDTGIIEIIDLNGIVWYENTVSSVITLEHLPPGMYLIRLTTTESDYFYKVIIQ